MKYLTTLLWLFAICGFAQSPPQDSWECNTPDAAVVAYSSIVDLGVSWRDLTGYGSPSVAYGAVTWSNNYWYLSNVSGYDYLTAAATYGLNRMEYKSEFTLSFWVNTSTLPGTSYLVTRDSPARRFFSYVYNGALDIAMRVADGGDLVYGSYYTSSSSFADGCWHNYTYINQSGYPVRLYVDGKEASLGLANTSLGTGNFGSCPLMFGYNYDESSPYCGKWGPTIIISKALSSAEIMDMYMLFRKEYQ